MSPDSLAMSMGMPMRWHAKMVFMSGMYWCAKSPETDNIRIRDMSAGDCVAPPAEEDASWVFVVFVVVEVEARSCCLFM